MGSRSSPPTVSFPGPRCGEPTAVECDYAVIGGGFAGLHCARKLADAGFHVTVLESTDMLMGGASRHNMARIHHGWHYPGNLATALECIPAAFDFLEEFGDLLLRGDQDPGRPLHTGLIVLAAGTFTSPDKWLEQAEAMRTHYALECGRRASSFGTAEEFFRVVDTAGWDRRLNPEQVLLAVDTLEPFVDLPALAASVIRAACEHPRIIILKKQQVAHVRLDGAGGEGDITLGVRTNGGVVREFRARRVLNASWTSRRDLDASVARQLGVAEPPIATYRLRVLLRVRLTDDLRSLRSLLFAHGPFASFTNCQDGTGLVMYEPVSNVAAMAGHVPTDWQRVLDGGLTNVERAHFARSILDGVARYIPALRSAEALEVNAGTLHHVGRVDFQDPTSEIHHRLGTGVKAISGYWLSLDSGKLSWIPRYARDVVKLSGSAPVLHSGIR